MRAWPRFQHTATPYARLLCRQPPQQQSGSAAPASASVRSSGSARCCDSCSTPAGRPVAGKRVKVSPQASTRSANLHRQAGASSTLLDEQH